MKYILVIIMTMGAVSENTKTIEMSVPQENSEGCLMSATTFTFILPIPLHSRHGDTMLIPIAKWGTWGEIYKHLNSKMQTDTAQI